MAPSKTQPIIVIKKKGGHGGGHNGGAWKVAYADFVTAMMSLFIVLWLMGSSEKVKKAVSGYFNDPKGTGALLGTTICISIKVGVPSCAFPQSWRSEWRESERRESEWRAQGASAP